MYKNNEEKIKKNAAYGKQNKNTTNKLHGHPSPRRIRMLLPLFHGIH
jgi:hypothetical protein